MTYASLRNELRRAGAFDPGKFYYAWQASSAFGIFGLAVLLLFHIHSLWMYPIVASVLAFASTRLGLLGHDLGHGQVFKAEAGNFIAMIGLIPLIGVSPSWWKSAHNAHHIYANDTVSDSHSNISVLAFSHDQFALKSDALRKVVKFQKYYFLPLLMLEGLVPKVNSWMAIIKGEGRHRGWEGAGLILHTFGMIAGAVIVLGPWHAALLVVLMHGVMGLYWGLLFAPNHKGMEQFTPGDRPDFVSAQVRATRNVTPNLFVDMLFGGLNYQIEHHLFPDLPRRGLKVARPIVRRFCEYAGFTYVEVNVLESYAITLHSLGDVVVEEKHAEGKHDILIESR